MSLNSNQSLKKINHLNKEIDWIWKENEVFFKDKEDFRKVAMKKSVKLVSVHSTLSLLRSQVTNLKWENSELKEEMEWISKWEEELKVKLKWIEIQNKNLDIDPEQLHWLY